MEKPQENRTTQTVQPNEPATARLIEPFGGRLVDLLVSDEEGQLKGFTGIDDPYEPPQNAEITLDTVNCSAEENAERIVMYLLEHGFIRPAGYVDEAANEFEYEEELRLA